jgi:hypothetical protein
MNTQTTLRLNNVRLSFPSLFKATAMKAGDKPAFSCHLILPPDHPDLPALLAAIREVANGKWTTNGEAMLKQLSAQDRVCLRKGDTKMKNGEVLDGYAGNLFVSARSQSRPTIVDQNRAPLDEASGKPYSGCYVNAFIAIWAQTGQYGNRINAQIQAVQFAKDGDPFGGGGAASPDVFDTLSDEFAGAEAATAEAGADLF